MFLPDTGLLFWMVIVFAIVVAILAKFGFPVITRMVRRRNEHIEDSLRLASEADLKMGQMRQEQERLIAQAREEQTRILKEAAQVRDSIITKAQAQAHEEARKILDEARVRIEAEKESAFREIRGQVALLSVKVAEKVIRKELGSDKEQMDLVYRMLDEVSASAKTKQQS